MLLDSNLPLQFWAEAISTALYMHQRLPSSSLQGKSPYQMLYNEDPQIHHLRRFGCVAWKYIPKQQRKDKKFESRSKPCVFVGYVHDTTTIWRIWDPKT